MPLVYKCPDPACAPSEFEPLYIGQCGEPDRYQCQGDLCSKVSRTWRKDEIEAKQKA